MTLNITTFCMMAHRIMAFSLMKFSKTTFSIAHNNSIGHYGTQNNNSQHQNVSIMTLNTKNWI
jgi:hypothetical protein